MHKSLRWYFPIFVLPTLVAFMISFLVPFGMGIYLSFCEFRTISSAKWVGIKNFTRIFENTEFTDALWFTVKFAVVSVVTINLFAFIVALVLTKSVKGTNLFRTSFFMPNLIGGIVLGYIWLIIINGVLGLMNVQITFDPNYGFWGLIVLMNWQLIGYMMIIYIAGIQNIPAELIEAAKIDGATSWQIIKHITIPKVMPSITICLFLTSTNAFKLFDQNLALTNGAPGRQTSMLALDIFNTFYTKMNHEGVGQAKAVVFFVIVAVIVLTQLFITRRKEVED